MATVDNEDYLACTIFPRAGRGPGGDGCASVVLAGRFPQADEHLQYYQFTHAMDTFD